MKKILIMHSKGGTGKTLLSASLSDLLPNSELVDLDPQMSLSIGMSHTGRKEVKTSLEQISNKSDFVIIDTPPYRTSKTEGLIESADYIIIPCSDGFTDLFSATKTEQILRQKNAINKSFFVFSRVRLPINNTIKEIREAFKSNFSDVKIIPTVVSQRLAYQRVFTDEISGAAKKEIASVLNDIGIRY